MEALETVSSQTLEELEAVIERGLTAYEQAGLALAEIRDRRLYREQGYSAFEDYCRERWNWSKTHANRQIDAAQIAGLLTPIGVIPQTESQARELAPLMRHDETEVIEVWRELKQEYGDDLTADRIKRTVRNRLDEVKRKRELSERRTVESQQAPVITSNRFRLLLGDFAKMTKEIEPHSISTIITDPPYPREYLPVYETLAQTATQLLVPGGSLLVMIGQSYLPEILSMMTPYLQYHWTLSYLTPGGQAVQLFQRKVNTFWKPVLWFVNGDYQGEWVGDVAKSAVNDNDKRFHEWGQSESGMTDLVERFSKQGETILDPFCGAGTTGVVAVRLNRRFLGIDCDSNALDQARARLQNEVAHVRS